MDEQCSTSEAKVRAKRSGASLSSKLVRNSDHSGFQIRVEFQMSKSMSKSCMAVNPAAVEAMETIQRYGRGCGGGSEVEEVFR